MSPLDDPDGCAAIALHRGGEAIDDHNPGGREGLHGDVREAGQTDGARLVRLHLEGPRLLEEEFRVGEFHLVSARRQLDLNIRIQK